MLEYVFSGSISTTVLVGLVAALVLYWLIQKWKYKYPPGPPSLPLLGHILRQEVIVQQLVYFRGTVKDQTVMFSSVNYLNTDGNLLNFERWVEFSTFSVDVFTLGGKDIIFSNYGPTWKLQRKISSKALRYSFADKEVTYILEKDDEFIEKFGMGPWEDFIPGLRHVYKTEMLKFIEDFTKELTDDFLRPKLNQARETFDKNNLRHFTDNLLLARLEAEEKDGKLASQQLDDDRLVMTISDIFLAGIDPSRYTLKSAILHMAVFPDIQEKVYEEIDRVVGKGRLPGLKDRPDLGYTEAVLHESMRLSSVAPVGVMHMALCDTDIAGYRIPKGTRVAVNHWALHHDPEVWEEVDRFIPERYLDENGKLGPKPKNWLPFSAGKRVCLGEFVAKPNLHLIFAGLMQRYKWTMKSGKCPDLTPTGGSLGLMCKPYKIMVELRI